jgi:hypothetical protein
MVAATLTLGRDAADRELRRDDSIATSSVGIGVG